MADDAAVTAALITGVVSLVTRFLLVPIITVHSSIGFRSLFSG